MAYDPNYTDAPLGTRPGFNRARLGQDVGLGLGPNRAGGMANAAARMNGGAMPMPKAPVVLPNAMFPNGAGGPPRNNDGTAFGTQPVQVDPGTGNSFDRMSGDIGGAGGAGGPAPAVQTMFPGMPMATGNAAPLQVDPAEMTPGVVNGDLTSDQPAGTSAFGDARSRMSPGGMSGAFDDLRRRRLAMGGAGAASGGMGGFGSGRFNSLENSDVSPIAAIRSQLRPTSPIRDTLDNMPRGVNPLMPEPPNPDGSPGGTAQFAPVGTYNLKPSAPKPTAPSVTAPTGTGGFDYAGTGQPAFKNGGRVLRDANGGRVRRMANMDPAEVGLGVPGKSRGAASGNSGSVMALADGGRTNLEQFHYDPSKPIESQVKEFLNGRNPYGEMKDPNWFRDPSLYQQYAQPDESGTQNYGYRAVDPRLADIQPGAVGPEWNSRIIDNQYTPVGWSASSHPDAVNGLKPDSMYDYGHMYYDPRFGLVQDGNNVRDPDARHDAWYGAGLMAAVAGPAIAGIMGGAGAAAGAGEGTGGSMTGIAGDESAGLAGTGGGGGGAGGGAGLAGDESAGLSMGPGGGSGIGADESAGLSMGNGSAGSGIGADESAGLSMNPGEGPSTGIGADESAGLNMDPPDYGLDTTQINPVELQQNPQIQQMAQRSGMSVGDWLKDPRNLQTAGRVVGAIVSATGGGGHAPQAATIPDPGTGTGAPGTGPGAPAGPDTTGTMVDSGAITSSLFNKVPQADGGSANWNAMRGQVQPLQDMLFGEAMKAGTPAEQEAAAARAGADTAQAFKVSRDRARAQMVAQGMNPNDPRGVAGEMARLSALDEAKATTSGQNLARIAEKNKGFTERAQAIGLGNTAAAQGLQADQTAANTSLGNARIASDVGLGGARISADIANANAGRANQRALQGQQLGYQDKWNTANQAIDRARVNAGITQANTQANRQHSQDIGSGVSTAINAGRGVYDLGSSAGWWADGGRIDVGLGTAKKVTRGYRKGGRVAIKPRSYDSGGPVDGPGSSTSDSIRARLSDGEHVLNAEAVELMDQSQPGALDELNQQGLKIRAVREALRHHAVGLGD